MGFKYGDLEIITPEDRYTQGECTVFCLKENNLKGECIMENEIKNKNFELRVAEGEVVLEAEIRNKENNNPSMKIRIKYFEGATKLKKISKGNWIDVYANKDVFVLEGERAMIPLGFALELPQGYEGHLAPRSSTFKTWGLIQTNSVGVVDDSYIGDNDQWHMSVYCLQGKVFESIDESDCRKGTWVKKGDKIGQFRIMEVMPEIELEEVESFGNADRGGFGSTGSR